MKYFMPDWEDKVDPTFDFQTDTFTPGRHIPKDFYAHEILQTPPYDGILVSRAVVENSRRNYGVIRKLGAHKYLRLSEGLEVFGDCGAFSYVNENEPRYETEEVLDYYHKIGVDYGASVDHLVVHTIYATQTDKAGSINGSMATAKNKKKLSKKERERRVDLTLDNAHKFVRLHKKLGYKFTPVGVVQGDAPKTYAHGVKNLLKMGYTYIAFGGLARSNATQILDVLRTTQKVVQELRSRSSNDIRFHLFGVAKLTLISELPKYGVASIDSASYLRKAWLRSGQNYLGADGQWYTAIRVPQSHHPKVREFVRNNGKSPKEVHSLEQSCLKMLQHYGDKEFTKLEFEELLDTIVEYDTYLLRYGDDGQKIRNKVISKEKYRRTLEARPWESCNCGVCRDLGIHALIFRGTNRNKRRGFHNTWTFYQRFRSVWSN